MVEHANRAPKVCAETQCPLRTREASNKSGVLQLPSSARSFHANGKDGLPMQDRHFFTEHYGAIVVTSYMLVMAMVIFFMTIPLSVQLLLLIVSAAGFAVTIRPADPPEPVAAGSNLDGVIRPPRND